MPIIVDAKLNLAKSSVVQMDALAKSADNIRKGLRGANRELGNLVNQSAQALKNFQGMASASGRIKAPGSSGPKTSASSTSGRSGTSTRPPKSFDHDPEAGMRHYAQAAAAGDPVAGAHFAYYKNLASRRGRNQASAKLFQQGQNSPFGSMIADVIARTRFGKGGKGMPLGVDMIRLMMNGQGDVLQKILSGTIKGAGSAAASGSATAAGSAAASGGTAATAASAGGMDLAATATAATEALAAMGPAGWAVIGVLAAVAAAGLTVAVAFALAGKAADYYAAQAKARVLSGGSDLESYRAQLINKVTGASFTGAAQNTNPIVASMAGISPFTGPFGDMNYSGRAAKIFDLIRRQKSLESARRVAALAGDPSLANAYLLDDTTARQARNVSSAPDWKNGATAVNFNAQKDLVGANLERLEGQVLAPLMSLLLPLLKKANDYLEDTNLVLSALEQWLHISGSDKDAKDQKFKDAVDKFGGYVNQMNGVYGGGRRSSRAANQGPKGWNPGYGNDKMGVL